MKASVNSGNQKFTKVLDLNLLHSKTQTKIEDDNNKRAGKKQN